MFSPAPPEVLSLATRWLDAGLNRDLDFLRIHSVTPDNEAIHTIAGTPCGPGLTLEQFLTHLGEVPPRMSVTSAPVGYAIGDVAWITDHCTVDMLQEGVLEGRFTAVFVRDEGQWKVVHSHLSEPVPHDLG